MMRLSQASRVLGAEHRGADVEFSAVGIDSRAVRRGELFVALKGERFDGHAFLGQVQQAGAAAALVDRTSELYEPAAASGFPLLMVEDTFEALSSLAAYWRRQFDIPLIALTGSSGKTTVKEMLASILREAAGSGGARAGSEACVLATRGNLNNHIGVPLTLLELRPAHRYAVVEMGMNHAGEIRHIACLAEPDVALITNAGRAHIENLGSEEAIARAKGEIFEGLKPNGVAVINADQRYAGLWRELEGERRRVEFGLATSAAVSATYQLRELDCEIVLKTPLGTARAVVPAPGLHNVQNAVAASAAAAALDIAPAIVAAGLARFSNVGGRLQRKPGLNGATLIDDTYNANPDSARAAIDALALAVGQKIFVLGDMGELGSESPAMHAEVGAYARAAGVHRLYTLGTMAQQAALAFGAGARHCATLEELVSSLEAVLAPGVTALVKGSRFMKMERVVQSCTLKTAGAEA